MKNFDNQENGCRDNGILLAAIQNCSHRLLLQMIFPSNQWTLMQSCPFCLATYGEESLAFRLASGLVEQLSFGNVGIFPQKIYGLSNEYRFWCHVQRTEFHAPFISLGGNSPFGCPHCASTMRKKNECT